MRIAVAGGTGVVGRHVVDAAAERGHDAVVLSRAQGVDLTTAAGLIERLAGVDAVIDTSNQASQRRAASEAFFGGVTRALLAAEHEVGVAHHIVLSIVGVDDVNTGYYAGKRLQERLVAEGEIPWSILRSTQFYEFAEQVLAYGRFGPISFVPQMTSQPIAAREVGEHLVGLAEAGPAGRVPDLAGPEVIQMTDLARRVVRGRRRVVPLPVPGPAGRAMRSGALCPTGPGPRGDTRVDRWLRSRE